MNDWITPAEAMAYFGVTSMEDLEDIIVEFDTDALVTDDGRLLGVKGVGEMQEALMKRHEREVGHRPDDPAAHDAAVALHHATQAQLKAQRKAERVKHVDKRVKARKEARDGRTATADTGT